VFAIFLSWTVGLHLIVPRADYKVRIKREVQECKRIPFSAFWLRSSVVSVLISLISDTRLIEPHDINLIFLECGAHRAACCQSPRASPCYCTTNYLAGATLYLRGPKQCK
jgi:hypothetical protein